jgi:D-arabinose 1-dehydrogenase-like Zn-dependent alcohol dehydrogenase
MNEHVLAAVRTAATHDGPARVLVIMGHENVGTIVKAGRQFVARQGLDNHGVIHASLLPWKS